jgi:hypothetical protein
MALKTNETATLFSQKKLLGKAHTSNLNLDVNEAIGSNIQASTSLVFGEAIPTSPSLTLHQVQSSTVEYVEFALVSIDGSTYDANDAGGGAGSDSGESSQSSGPHAYAFKFKSNYQTVTNNPLAGNGNYNNNKIVHETLGSVQLVPPFYSREAVNPYIIKIYKDNGSGAVGDEIPILDDIDWQVDTYNGVLFVQDYNASKIPAFARAFIYVGSFADAGKFANGLSGSLTQLTDGKSYLVAGSNVTITSASNGQVTIASTGGGGGTPAGSNTQIQFNDGGSFGASSAFTFNGTEVTLNANSPTINLHRTNNNQNSDIDFKGAGGVVGARLRFSGSASNDLVLTTFTGATLKERLRIRSNTADVAIEATGSLRVSSGITGSLTKLNDGTSYILANGSITATTQSNGSIVLSAANSVFNEYIGEANGSNTRFTLAKTPTANKNVSVFVNGQLQMPATNITGAPFQDYSVTGSVIHFVTASLPLEGSLLMANYTTNQSIS